MAYAEVAFPQPPHFGQSYSYAIPTGMELQPGDAVVAPFGPRTLSGIVVAVAGRPVFEGDLRTIEARAGSEPLLAPHHVALAHWLAGQYFAPLGQALTLFMPAGSRDPATLATAPASTQPAALRLLMTADEALMRLAREKPAVSGRALRCVAALLEAGGSLPLQTVEKGLRVGRATLLLLEEQRIVERVGLQRRPAPDANLLGAGVDGSLRHTPEQRTAIAAIDEAMQRRFQGEPAAGAFLLHGVTGSGKTEVYIAALRLARARGRSGIVLVPEIALTPQTAARFETHFPGAVALLHGRIGVGRRRALWQRVRAGDIDAVIGARSALFAPVQNPGVIVLDEEHDPSYKQGEPAPRYQAREAALELGRLTGAVVILGSATPDVGSFRRVSEGAYRLLSLPRRVVGGTSGAAAVPLPVVEVVDMAAELRAGNANIFSRALATAMRETLAAGEQVLLFLNRRGSASLMLCRDCGFAPRCPRCSVAYALHADVGRLICHQCYHSRRVPSACPKCHSERFRPVGIGTQRLEEIVKEQFPQHRTLRWDGDTAATHERHAEIAGTIARREVDIVVGTQVVTKGHDFGALTLVGVVSADLSLNMPDFRAAERTFQLLVQVAGRAGRREQRGRVVIQTYAPSHYAVRAAATGDYDAFYRSELAFRRELAYPPCAPLTRLLLQDRRGPWAQGEALRYAEALEAQRRRLGWPEPQVVGPAPCYFARVAGRWRWQLLLRGEGSRELLSALPPPRGWTVDVEPVDLL